MRPATWSLLVTAAAAALYGLHGRDIAASELRWMGLGGGALLALGGVLFGVLRPGRARAALRPPDLNPLPRRFFGERRRAPRHGVEIPVRVSIDGQTCDATLLCISASGALLRWRGDPGRMRSARLGQPVTIADYPAGTIARIGPDGLFVDFAVAFDRTPAPCLEPAEHGVA